VRGDLGGVVLRAPPVPGRGHRGALHRLGGPTPHPLELDLHHLGTHPEVPGQQADHLVRHLTGVDVAGKPALDPLLRGQEVAGELVAAGLDLPVLPIETLDVRAVAEQQVSQLVSQSEPLTLGGLVAVDQEQPGLTLWIVEAHARRAHQWARSDVDPGDLLDQLREFRNRPFAQLQRLPQRRRQPSPLR